MSTFIDLEWDTKTGEIHEAYAETESGKSWYRSGSIGRDDLVELAAFLRGRLIGHNISADIAVLRKAAKTLGMLGFDRLQSQCTLAMSRARLNLESYTLDDVAQALGIEVDDERRHTAQYDAQLARDVYRRLLGVPSRSKNRGRSRRGGGPRNGGLASLGW